MKRSKCIFAACLLFIFVMTPVVSCAGANAVNQNQQGQQGTASSFNVTPLEAWKIIQKNKGNPNFVLLDVRTPKEFFNGRIAGAINHNFYDLNFNKELSKLDRSKTYLVYCRTGVRSAAAQKVMFKLGFKKVYNMLGGILSWKKNNLPMISGQ